MGTSSPQTMLLDTQFIPSDTSKRLDLTSFEGQCSLLSVMYHLCVATSLEPNEGLKWIKESLGNANVTTFERIQLVFRRIVPGVELHEQWKDIAKAISIISSFYYDAGYIIKRHLTQRRFFRTAAGYLGTAPLHANEEDLVCGLRGSTRPVLLRREGSHFIHIGLAFVLGFMDGEVDKCVAEGSLRMQEFDICWMP